jgi:hypothetical protein
MRREKRRIRWLSIIAREGTSADKGNGCENVKEQMRVRNTGEASVRFSNAGNGSAAHCLEDEKGTAWKFVCRFCAQSLTRLVCTR